MTIFRNKNIHCGKKALLIFNAGSLDKGNITPNEISITDNSSKSCTAF